VGYRTLRLTWFACALLAAAVWARPTMAHPHVWISVEARVVHENGFFTGIAQTWSFDEFYTAYAVQGLDTNRDGIYERGELAELTRKFSGALAELSYFTSAELRGETIRFGSPSDFRLEVKDGILSLSFTLPFGSPVPQGAQGLTFSVSDPARFIAFELVKVGFLASGGGLPDTCRIGIVEPDADALTAPPPGGIPDDFRPALMGFSGTVSVACAAP
jgi:ABC-type uncharacterized transport system substrate-binding protein